MFKKIFIYIALFVGLFGIVTIAKADNGQIFHGYAEINEEFKETSDVLTDEKTEVVKGAHVSMVVSNIINTETNAAGDEFFAEITNDVSTDKGVVIPAGSIAHGTITEIVNAKRFNRDANITLNFDYIATPDGREIPISAKMTTKRNPVHNAAVVTAQHAGYTLAGGAMGSLVALNTLGLVGAIASNGYTIAGGAAIGGAIGLGIAMSKKGDEVLLAPGDSITVKIADNINLPVFKPSALVENELKNDNLLVGITSYRLEKDPFGEPNTITIGVNVTNKMNKSFSTFDMALMNENNAIYYASPFGDADMWFKKIPPNATLDGKVSFSVDNPNQKLWLVFFDGYNKKPLVKLSLNNAKRDIAEATTKKKKKK